MIPSLEGYAKRGVGLQSAGKDFCKQLLVIQNVIRTVMVVVTFIY